MEQDQKDLLLVSSEIAQSLNPPSIDAVEMHEISSNIYVDDKQKEEIGVIAEREISFNKFAFVLKIKRTVLIVCYLILFVVELIYFRYFAYWFICPLLLCLSWIFLLALNTNLYQYLHQRTLMRLLFVSSLSILNILTVVSLIIVYSLNFGQMDHFDHSRDYNFKILLSFNILSLFCSFCMDINIVDYVNINRECMVYAYKIIFIGCINTEKYSIQEINGDWIAIRYKFQHPFQLQMDEPINKIHPIGVWQRLIIIFFMIGTLGSLIFTINGIQEMQPYILH